MMVVMLSSNGGSWTFYATVGDKVFMIETSRPPEDKLNAAVEHMVRECRWMFGDRRIIFLTRDDDWVEVLHDGAGHIKGYEPYIGPVPKQGETYYE